ncbi:MAG: PAS domain S-box protein [Bacteroidetes bacterium]|nr:PAS domain S-box protein [Bacteroidota bacterium]
MNNKQIQLLVDVLKEYSKGNYSIELPSGSDDLADEIRDILAELKKTLASNEHLPLQQARIKKILDLILQYASFNFSEKLEISGGSDDLDKLAAGLNTLGEVFENKIQEVYQSNEQFKKLTVVLETTADSVTTITPEGILASWNKSAERIYGYTAQEMIGKRPDETLQTDDSKAEFRNVLEQIKNGKGAIDFQTKRRRKDGKIIDVSITLSPIYNDRKKLVSISAISRDISAHKASEQTLRESEERFRLLVESIKEYAIFKIDPDGNVSSWNKGAEYMTGYTEKEITGKHISVFYTKESIQKNEPQEDLETALEDGFQRSVRWKLKKDATLFYAESVCTPFYNDKGELKGFSKVIKDITEKQKLDDAFRDQREQIETIIANAPSGVIVINEKGEVLKWNSKSEQIFGWKLEEVINQPMHKFIMPERYVSAHYHGLHHYLKTGEGPILNKTIEITAMRRNKEEFPIELGISSVRAGANYLFIAFINDITERKKGEEQLKKTYEALNLSNKELEAFTYSVSHDLRAPVRAIQSYSEILKEKLNNTQDEESKALMNSVIRNTKKMAQLINDLLELSRLGQTEIDREVISVNKVVATVLESLKDNESFKKTKFSVSDLPEAYADFNLMIQVFQNLISNAVKYSSLKKEPVVTISSLQNDNNTVYYVKDNGSGFDMKYYDKLFGVFQRLHSQEEFEGTGVGLTIVKRIVDKHHGKIWAEAEIEKGAAFYFYISKN